jgi:hypothetical protein
LFLDIGYFPELNDISYRRQPAMAVLFIPLKNKPVGAFTLLFVNTPMPFGATFSLFPGPGISNHTLDFAVVNTN